jgi:hypothetical protein
MGSFPVDGSLKRAREGGDDAEGPALKRAAPLPAPTPPINTVCPLTLEDVESLERPLTVELRDNVRVAFCPTAFLAWVGSLESIPVLSPHDGAALTYALVRAPPPLRVMYLSLAPPVVASFPGPKALRAWLLHAA